MKVVIDNPTFFDETRWFLWSDVGGVKKDPFPVFQKGKADAEDYFNGLYKFEKDQWSSLKK